MILLPGHASAKTGWRAPRLRTNLRRLTINYLYANLATTNLSIWHYLLARAQGLTDSCMYVNHQPARPELAIILAVISFVPPPPPQDSCGEGATLADNFL
jgi:hypothetical protein